MFTRKNERPFTNLSVKCESLSASACCRTVVACCRTVVACYRTVVARAVSCDRRSFHLVCSQCKIISNPYVAVKMHECGHDRGRVHRKGHSQRLSRDVLLTVRRLCIMQLC